MHPYIKGLKKILHENRNDAVAIPMKQYMRNQFEYFGLKTPQRRALCISYMKSKPLPEGKELREIVLQLWELPERDFQYFAMELLVKCRKQWVESDIGLFEHLITNKSWWDTVDLISGQLVGEWFRKFPQHIEPFTSKWNKSDNIWLQRTSILFQLKYKKNTNLKLLYDYIKHLSTSDEFFVQKAIGWILREYSKTDPEEIRSFLKTTKLKPLSVREAKKRMGE